MLGKRSLGNPDATFEEEGDGNVITGCARHRSTLRVSSKGWYIQQEINLPGQKSKSRSLGSSAKRNRSAKAYRQSYQKDNSKSSGHSESEHIGGLVRY